MLKCGQTQEWKWYARYTTAANETYLHEIADSRTPVEVLKTLLFTTEQEDGIWCVSRFHARCLVAAARPTDCAPRPAPGRRQEDPPLPASISTKFPPLSSWNQITPKAAKETFLQNMKAHFVEGTRRFTDLTPTETMMAAEEAAPGGPAALRPGAADEAGDQEEDDLDFMEDAEEEEIKNMNRLNGRNGCVLATEEAERKKAAEAAERAAAEEAAAAAEEAKRAAAEAAAAAEEAERKKAAEAAERAAAEEAAAAAEEAKRAVAEAAAAAAEAGDEGQEDESGDDGMSPWIEIMPTGVKRLHRRGSCAGGGAGGGDGGDGDDKEERPRKRSRDGGPWKLSLTGTENDEMVDEAARAMNVCIAVTSRLRDALEAFHVHASCTAGLSFEQDLIRKMFLAKFAKPAEEEELENDQIMDSFGPANEGDAMLSLLFVWRFLADPTWEALKTMLPLVLWNDYVRGLYAAALDGAHSVAARISDSHSIISAANSLPAMSAMLKDKAAASVEDLEIMGGALFYKAAADRARAALGVIKPLDLSRKALDAMSGVQSAWAVLVSR